MTNPTITEEQIFDTAKSAQDSLMKLLLIKTRFNYVIQLKYHYEEVYRNAVAINAYAAFNAVKRCNGEDYKGSIITNNPNIHALKALYEDIFKTTLRITIKISTTDDTLNER